MPLSFYLDILDFYCCFVRLCCLNEIVSIFLLLIRARFNDLLVCIFIQFNLDLMRSKAILHMHVYVYVCEGRHCMHC